MALDEKQIAPRSEIRMPMASFCGGGEEEVIGV
jgi:hypothetical protein